MRVPRSLAPLLYISTLALGSWACSDEGPVDPTVLAPPPSRAISDAAHGGGNKHFFWLPPMVGARESFNGAFDATKEPVVRVCGDLAVCDTEPLARFSMTTGPGSETVRVDPSEERYIVNWHTDDFDVRYETPYRIVVRVGGTELGYADIQLVSNGSEARNLTTEEVIGLKDGRTLPIGFRIEEGAIFVVTREEGGTVEALDGTVTLDFPAGAVTEEDGEDGSTGITVEVVEPTGEAVSVAEFGPDGLGFDEPVPVTMVYDPVLLPPDVPEEDLALNLLVGDRWIVLPGGSIDIDANQVTAPFWHFSTAGVGPADLAVFCSGDENPDTFESLQEAVDAVRRNGTVEICDGIHPAEGVVLDQPVNIVPAEGASPMLRTSAELAAFWVDGYTAGTVVVDGLTFDFDTPDGGGPESRSYAIRAQGSYDQLVVRNTVFHVDGGARGGIFARLSSVPGAATVVENSQFGGGVFGIAAENTHLDVTAGEFRGTGSTGIIYFGTTSPSSGRVEASTFDDCGTRYCVWAVHGPDVEVVSNDFITPAPTGDVGPDLDQVVRATGGGTTLIDDNDFVGCGYHRCILGASGASLTVTNNRFTLPGSDGANANPEHAVLVAHPGVAAVFENNQVDGCWTFCVQVQPTAAATIRGNTMTIPNGHPPIAAAIFGNGGADFTPGVVPDPADAPTLVVDDNLVEALGAVGDVSNVGDYQINYGIWLQNAVASSVSGNTIRRATVGFRVLEGAEIQAGTDNVVETAVWAVQTSHVFPDGVEQPEDDGRVTIHDSDLLDYHNSIWGRPGDTSSDLTCNFWGGPTGAPGAFTNDGMATAVYTPWATAPIANGAGGACDGMPLAGGL